MTPDAYVLSVEAYEIVSHVLTLGYAGMAAALLYFVLTMNWSARKYRMTSVLSVVVMVSAALLLYAQQNSWTAAYAYEAGQYVLEDGADLFTNGYRYLNWLIDVPMLLIQILFVAGITGAARTKNMVWFSVAGTLMIVTGYIGQFYEPGRLNADLGLWMIWGLVSTAFFGWVLVLITRVMQKGKANMRHAPRARSVFSAILPLFYVAWMLYPGAYLMPGLMTLGVADYEFAIVAQQMTYTAADISSKIIYGVMLGVAAMRLTEVEEGELETSYAEAAK
jgi:bacteriorhodopsin